MVIRAKVLAKYGDNIDTDIITSAKYVTSVKPEDLARIAMIDMDPDFPSRMEPGGFLVAGKNFGCGSSREWAPVALKGAGVKAVIAESFARIFYRNAITIGLVVIECPRVSEKINQRDELEVDAKTGEIRNLTTGETLEGIPIPDFLLDRFEKGFIRVLQEKVRRKVRKT